VRTQPKNKLFPTYYQNCLQASLTESQYVTLQLVVMLLQAHRKVCLSQLATLFLQPIKYESRLRNLQRFLCLPRLNVKLLWFPIVKQMLKKQWRQPGQNRAQRRQQQKLTHQGCYTYSPDFNKIERCWSWLKYRIRQSLNDFDCFRDAMEHISKTAS
jgi:hypothetical protein